MKKPVRIKVKGLEETGIIAGYRANVALKTLGYPISAYLKITINRGYYRDILKKIQRVSEVIECYQTAREDGIILKIVSNSVKYFAKVIDDILEKYPSWGVVILL